MRGAIFLNLPSFSNAEILLEMLESDEAKMISLVVSMLFAIQILVVKSRQNYKFWRLKPRKLQILDAKTG